MTNLGNETSASKIFENIIFLAEVFGDQADKDIPKIPVLEMAQCFDLVRTSLNRRGLRRRMSWPLWN